jgi:carboxyl-terminal processing protease
VQAQFPLSEGALLLTIAHYYTPSGRLIQRDYTKGSFFDYYYARKPIQNSDDIKATDTGRKMYGGGGITPDEKYEPEKSTMFERRVFNSSIIYRFANSYFGPAKPTLPANWAPDADLMARFKDFLHTKNIAFTDAEFNRDKKWITEQIRDEFYLRAFDKKTSDRAQFMDDPEVQKALDSLPKAEAMHAEAQTVMAARRQ